MAWDYYKDGQRIDIAGIKILTLSRSGTNKRDVLYSVFYQCCQRVGTLSHAQIDKRTKAETTGCQKCAGPLKRQQQRAAARAEDDYGFTYPGWPKPPSIPTGYWLWGDYHS